MKLERHEWAQLLRHLDTALDLTEPERPAWIEALALPARLDAALREMLQDRRAIETGDFLSQGARVWEAGAALSPWLLLRELGRGGMATVWLARRLDGAHAREVALKLPHPRWGSRVLAERFVRERAILSTLQHPHIAQVLDAGESAGQPWLALEYVEGRPITEHAQALGLDVAARLRLVLPVLRAVEHAHAQLVIHRDLKPANVLVSAAGEVKLLDFGVAKLLDDDGLGTDTALTRESGRALTPQYASPEQIAGRPLGVASDVYSLGVLLYELLTGRLPYQLRRASAAALEEAILAAQVAAPSSAVADKALARRLRGDLDTLILKALHPEPAQRYASAAALADDIERHLQARPILAHPPSLPYRLRKLWQRQRLALSAGAALLLALAAGGAGTLWQAQRAQDEAARAQAVQRFLVTLLQTADPQGGQARELTVGQLLDLNAGRIDREFSGQPEVQAQLLQTLANIYVERGEAAKGRPLLERAVALHAQAGRAGREPHVQALVDLAELQDEMGDHNAERRTLAQASALATEHFGPAHRWAAPLLASEAWLALKDGRLDQARRLGEQAQTRFGPPSPQSLRTAGSLATIYMALGDLSAAQAVLERSQRDAQRLGGEGSVDRLMTGYNLARLRFIVGEYAQAEAELAVLLPQFDHLAGPGQERTQFARGLWAQVLAARGRSPEAVAEARANLAAALAAQPPDSDIVQAQRATLANVLRQAGQAGQVAEALQLAQAALAGTEALNPQPTSHREAIRRVLGEVQLAAGQREAGIATLQTALAGVRALNTKGADLQQPLIQLLLAVAQRDTGTLARSACEARAAHMDEARPAMLRCRVIEAWLAALPAPEAGRAAFVAARDRLLASELHPRHPLRAELLALEAELAPPGPAKQGLLTQADRLYRELLGAPLPQPLLVLH
jgi:serine/threonine-protein kinase